jgi:hypothetical protein
MVRSGSVRTFKNPRDGRERLLDLHEVQRALKASTPHLDDVREDGPDPRITELKNIIRAVERCQRSRNDTYAVAFRNTGGELRKVLRDMERELSQH